MAIPKRSEIIPVILTVLSDGGEHTSPEMQAVAAKHFRLTPAELAETRGPHFTFENEHAFALNLLVYRKLILLLDGVRRLYVANPRGIKEAEDNAADGFRLRA